MPALEPYWGKLTVRNLRGDRGNVGIIRSPVRASIPPDRQLIREMSVANPLWGAPRIQGELLKLGMDVGQTTVAKYMAKRRRPPSQGWRTFAHNHADAIASIDMFVVPTISFGLLYGLLILRQSRRELLWLGVTAHPHAEWLARQLTEACGWDEPPRYLIRDRDGAYGAAFIRRIRAMGIRDRPVSARSPWQNGYAERLIGSMRRECLDHVVVVGERHLRHVLASYQKYHNEVRSSSGRRRVGASGYISDPQIPSRGRRRECAAEPRVDGRRWGARGAGCQAAQSHRTTEGQSVPV
jgi:transposase InsO family protein